MRTIFAVLLLIAPFALWFLVIKPRLSAGWTEIHANAGGFWARLRARLYAFRSFVAGVIAAVAYALPTLAEGLLGINLPFLPDPWSSYVGGIASLYLVVNRAFATKPKNEVS
jgi:hypothetical protein